MKRKNELRRVINSILYRCQSPIDREDKRYETKYEQLVIWLSIFLYCSIPIEFLF